MQQELVSIIMPSYNARRYVADSIESILRQTYHNWELLITDDHSTDGTQEILQQYAARDKRIRIFLMQENWGTGHTRNKCIQEARGRYIAFCDSDDRWLPEKLERQIAFMQKNDYAFTFASYYTCNEEGTMNGIVIAPARQTLTDTKRDDKIGFLTAIFDTTRCPKILMPTLRKRQDWAYVLMIHQHVGDAYSLKEPLGIYRLHDDSISHRKFSLVRYNAAVYREVFGYSHFQSFAYLFTFFLPTYFFKRVRTIIDRHRLRHLWQEATF